MKNFTSDSNKQKIEKGQFITWSWISTDWVRHLSEI